MVVEIQEASGVRSGWPFCPGSPTPEGEKGEDAALFCVGAERRRDQGLSEERL